MTATHSAGESNLDGCIACLEPIRPGARICPHCGSPQQPRRWHSVSVALKWIGGIVTVVSLLGGLLTLSGYYQDWRERRDSVAEIVAAADWLIRSENYRQAWEMYAKAAAINPSSALVRSGRFELSLLWLRNFRINPKLLDATLNDLTEILYRGLADADADQSATILAHVGYVQSIRKLNNLSIVTDVDALFRQALAASPENAYANAMLARWMLLQRPVTVAAMNAANRLIGKALTEPASRAFVRDLQFSAFSSLTSGYDPEIERTALALLLEASHEMLANDEGLPPKTSRARILDGYGPMGRAEHADALIAALPAEKHLQVYQWLLADDDDSRDTMRQQSTYVRARLNEELGNREQALAHYQTLYGKEIREELAKLVDRGIERLTGQLPARATARSYIDDPVDASHPFQFHLDTLENFEPTRNTTNFEQALAFFATQIEHKPQQLTSLELNLPTTIERVLESVRHGDYLEKIDAYSSGFNRYDHDTARANWIELVLLYARLLAAGNQHERALAQIGDAARAVGLLGDDWRPTQAWLDYEMARLHTLLAARHGSISDRERALTLLQSAVAAGVTDGDRVSWSDIKAEPFTLLGDDDRYRELVRGR